MKRTSTTAYPEVKLQSDLTYGTSQNMVNKSFQSVGFTYRLQLQLAI
jgi:hypothetical protein